MWQMWLQVLTKPLLNQQIAEGKEAVTEVGISDGLPESVSCKW